MRLPKAIEKVIESFERLPGVGPKTAQRLTFYLLHVPQSDLEDMAEALTMLKKETVMCSVCANIGENDPCWICTDSSRDRDTICIVEDPLDVLAIEKGGKYKGVYHVLHGVIDPLNSMGPDDIYIPQLIVRLKKDKASELILATNPTVEGEATALYIVREVGKMFDGIKITRIGRGLPIGADLEYADETTIERALEGRREY
ncbi:MAG: recombination protein RecR [Candidatus Levybacteria bacterium CG_4_10_14_0_2_um_filter_36_16]|nr:MAG: recombination protein RecR [Candidatus Levybacteria bacterium CG2_30_37_29]PIR79105.1 MAG: recombination protein RecR [Candidatus Levybacteria bacterium CG10_big_fil_rev_8_21_14_0_10_36_30]PIZ97629.1 MAG: recombination protein RecR [Candidatus Levybacteria bacterium CG_4_10_14_0_2_um_filter_36_16]PJA90249.1 MAG: recombination protein RecR [Candidatus Levybacteria bacterium CG_4_9_14_3_um_filter_36_7]